MKKRIIITIVLSVVLALATCLFAACGPKENTPVDPAGGLTFSLNADGASYTVSGIGTSKAADLAIPARYNGKPVTKIGVWAFEDRTELKSVSIPDSVTEIGDFAFSGCTGLTSVTIGANVASIGSGAFEECIGPETIFWNAENCTEVGEQAFADCASPLSAIFGENVKSIPKNAFADCMGLTSVTLGSEVRRIGDGAFGGCRKLVEVINHSAHITIEKSSSENGSVGLYAIDVYNDTTTQSKIVDKDGFRFYNGDTTYLLGYAGTNKALVLPDAFDGKPYAIYPYAFYGRTDITDITIPDPVASIGERAFENCTNITTATMPTTVISSIPKDSLQTVVLTSGTSIAASAFENCTALREITIPSSVTSIGENAFRYCTGLTAVHIQDLTAWCSIDFGGDIYYGYDANPLRYAHHWYIDGQEIRDLEIPQGVTEIKDGTFEGCTGLTSVTLGSGVTNIGYWAFYNCTSLTTVNWNATNCTSAGVGYHPIFSGCAQLATVRIGANVESIPDSAFASCKGLTQVTIPDSVTSIGSSAFADTGLESIAIPASVTSIGDRAFRGCTDLTSITVQQGNSKYHSAGNCLIETESKTLILGCKTSEIPTDESMTSIGDGAFSGCTGLTSVAIPASVTRIGGWAFSGCTDLESITIGSSVTSIGEWAFYNCTGLTSVTIPASVTSIDMRAFSNCTNLTTAVFENPSGWQVSENSDMSSAESISVDDASLAAQYLRNTYVGHYWHRS